MIKTVEIKGVKVKVGVTHFETTVGINLKLSVYCLFIKKCEKSNIYFSLVFRVYFVLKG